MINYVEISIKNFTVGSNSHFVAPRLRRGGL